MSDQEVIVGGAQRKKDFRECFGSNRKTYNYGNIADISVDTGVKKR